MTWQGGDGESASEASSAINIERIDHLDHLAHILDSAFRIPFTRFRIGLDAFIGLIPGVGDVAGLLASTYIVFEAARRGVPPAMLVRMVANVGIEALVGILPVVGDLFDAGWKANVKNVHLLERYMARPDATAFASRRWLVGVVGLLGLLVVTMAVFTFVVIEALVGLIVR